jgi:beta-glucanase (GH16 family)
LKQTKIYRIHERVIIAVVLVSCLVFCQKENTTEAGNGNNNDAIPVPEGWDLVWNDEFEGSAIDPNKWEHEVNADGGGNNELQYYTNREANSWVEDGFLTLQALKEHYPGPDGTREYTSARIRTAGKGDWKYGRFEIRAKLPEGQGLWPAIWMLSTYGNYGGWAASGEIDIMEELGQEPDKVYGTLHYGASYPNNVQQGRSFILPEGTFAEDFHTFAIEWDTTRFQWFVDDSCYSTITSWYTEGHDYPAPFNQKFHLIFNVAVGGNWPGSPDATTEFPQQMVVDYARVFQKEE